MNTKSRVGSIAGVIGRRKKRPANHTGIILAATMSICALLGASGAYAADAAPDIKESPNGEVTVIATLDVKPGSEANFEKASQLSIKCTRLEPGNVSFTIHKVLGENSLSYVMYEIWRNKAALQSHFAQPYTQALFGEFKRDLSAPPAMKFIVDLAPRSRSKQAKTDPKSWTDCR